MTGPFFKDGHRIQRVMNGVVAGTTDQTTSAVDMQTDTGYDEVTFLCLFGTLTSSQVTLIKSVQQSSDDGVADDYTDLAGSASAALADADSNKMLAITVRPSKRYVKLVIDRGTANAVIDGVIVILSQPHKRPTAQPTTITSWETTDYPAEGSA